MTQRYFLNRPFCVRLSVLLTILVLGIGCSFAQAKETSSKSSSAETASNDAVENLVRFFRPYVYELKQPISVYSWVDGVRAPVFPSGAFAANAPEMIEPVRARARAYWPKRMTPSQSLYGAGLYAAVDPTSSRSFGGEQNWFVEEIELPTGSRFINLLHDGNLAVPLSIRQQITSLGCPKAWEQRGVGYFDSLFSFNFSFDGSQTCADALKTVFDQRLGVDALAYLYFSSRFSECLPSPHTTGREETETGLYPDRRTAFVIVSDRRLGADNVRVFNSQSRDFRVNRIRIMSLFFKSIHDSLASSGGEVSPDTGIDVDFRQLLTAWLDENARGYVFSGTSFCLANPQRQCPHIQLNGNDEDPGRTLAGWPKVKIPPYPTIMNAASDALRLRPKTDSFLWADLEGEPTDPNAGPWLKEHFFGCSDHPQYEHLESPAHR